MDRLGSWHEARPFHSASLPVISGGGSDANCRRPGPEPMNSLTHTRGETLAHTCEAERKCWCRETHFSLGFPFLLNSEYRGKKQRNTTTWWHTSAISCWQQHVCLLSDQTTLLHNRKREEEIDYNSTRQLIILHSGGGVTMKQGTDEIRWLAPVLTVHGAGGGGCFFFFSAALGVRLGGVGGRWS